MFENDEIVFELTGEVGKITLVIDTLIELTRKFRGDRGDGHPLVRQHGKNEIEFGGSLGRGGFVGGDLDGERSRSLAGSDMTVDLPSLLHGGQEFCCCSSDLLTASENRRGEARISDRIAGMLFHQTRDRGRIGLLADRVSHIDREKVGSLQETVNGLQVDMISIHEVGSFPAKGGDRLIRFGSQGGWFGADQIVFAVGLVPDGRYLNSMFNGFLEGTELGFSLVTESVADAEGEWW